MSVRHTVEPGDYMAGIADEYGFADYHTIWDDPQNADLKQKRDPNVLSPGDVVVIPDKQPKSEAAATGAAHKFQKKGSPTQLKLRLLDFLGKPLANTAVQLTVDGQSESLTTDGDGRLAKKLPPGAREGTLKVGVFTYALRIGHLDPVEESGGAAARLRNLGYLADDGRDDPDPSLLRFAVALFQADHGLTVDGDDLQSIQAKLKEAHGS